MAGEGEHEERGGAGLARVQLDSLRRYRWEWAGHGPRWGQILVLTRVGMQFMVGMEMLQCSLAIPKTTGDLDASH